jgi:hypothetical protein
MGSAVCRSTTTTLGQAVLVERERERSQMEGNGHGWVIYRIFFFFFFWKERRKQQTSGKMEGSLIAFWG